MWLWKRYVAVNTGDLIKSGGDSRQKRENAGFIHDVYEACMEIKQGGRNNVQLEGGLRLWEFFLWSGELWLKKFVWIWLQPLRELLKKPSFSRSSWYSSVQHVKSQTIVKASNKVLFKYISLKRVVCWMCKIKQTSVVEAVYRCESFR